MIIKYCPRCLGRPYTDDISMLSCPNCNTALQSEMVNEQDLINRDGLKKNEPFSGFGREFPNAGQNDIFGNDKDNGFPGFSDGANNQHFGEIPERANDNIVFPSTATTSVPAPIEIKSEPDKVDSAAGTQYSSRTVKGKVSQYSSTGKEDGEYRRLLPVKLYQAIVYRQRLEDVLHRFTVRVEQASDSLGFQNYTDIPVNVHGTISGGLQIVDNAEVEVHGKYRNGVLMADSIYVINNGHQSKVGFQHSVKAITYGILSAVMLAFIIFVAATSNGNFLANIKEFCTVWLVIAAILTVLYLVTSLTKIGIITRMFSSKKRSFPIFGILLVSLALAFLFVNAFGSFAGFGSYLTGWVYALIPIIIVVVAMFFLIKSMF